MRTYGSIAPTFWTRGSGKKLRGKPFAQVLALYFMTGSATNMIGLYYVPRTTILHDTGIPEAELDAALAAVAEVGIAHYDPENELAYLPEGARYQIGEVLKPGDTKRKPILATLKLHGSHPFALQWIARYYDAYSLEREGLRRPDLTQSGALGIPQTMPHGIPHHMPHLGVSNTPGSDRIGSDPVLSQSAGEAGAKAPDAEPPAPPPSAPLVADLKVRAALWSRDPFSASLQYPNPERWAETVELNQLVATVFKTDPDTLTRSDQHGRIDPRVKILVDRWAEGIPQDRMRMAVRGAALDDFIRDRPTLQSIVTIFKDGNAVDKYCRLAKSKGTSANGASAPDKSNRVRRSPEAEAKRERFKRGEI